MTDAGSESRPAATGPGEDGDPDPAGRGVVSAELAPDGGSSKSEFFMVKLSFASGSIPPLPAPHPGARNPADGWTAGKKTISDAGWHALEIVRKDDTLKVSLDGAMEFEVKDLRHRRRVSPAIYLQGEGTELRIGHLKIEAL